MGWYEKSSYKRDRKGNWVLVRKELESAPTDCGRWQRSCELEKKANYGEQSFIITDITRSGINRKVKEVQSYFGPNEKVVRKLITTSSRLPKQKRGK